MLVYVVFDYIFTLKNNILIFYNMNQVISISPCYSFASQNQPDAKIAPIIIGGSAFVGKAIIGGVIGSAASWGTTRFLDNKFPPRK